MVVLLTLVLFLTARRVRSVLPDLFQWKELTVAQVATGAAAGGYSHVLLDGVMHPDVAPFAPWSYENGLLGVVSLETLHWFCVAAGAAALVILGARRFARQAVR